MKYPELFQNDILWSALVAWAVAQVLKTLIYAVQNRRFDLGRLFGDGGMPSGHSALVSAVATACGVRFGLASVEFAVSSVFALVVIHDAYGVRHESGKQAQVINELVAVLKSSSPLEHIQNLKELLGHTPLQVLFGCVVGISVALAFTL